MVSQRPSGDDSCTHLVQPEFRRVMISSYRFNVFPPKVLQVSLLMLTVDFENQTNTTRVGRSYHVCEEGTASLLDMFNKNLLQGIGQNHTDGLLFVFHFKPDCSQGSDDSLVLNKDVIFTT